MPKVMFLVAVHNAAPYVRDCVDSMLRQNYDDYGILAIDDASTDDSVAVLESCPGGRLQIERNDENLGLGGTLNRGLDMLDCEFVVRMDADDLCVRQRLQWQVGYMEQHPDVGICGGWMRAFGDWRMRGVVRYPSGVDSVHAALAFCNPISHPTVIMRRALLERHSLRYDPACRRTEDLDLWLRAVSHFDIDNIDRVLVRWRNHGSSVTVNEQSAMELEAAQLLSRYLARLGLQLDEEAASFHQRVGQGRRLASISELKRAESWLEKVSAILSTDGKLARHAVHRAVSMIWWRLCRNCGDLGPEVSSAWRNSDLSTAYSPAAAERATFVASVLWHGMRGSSGKGNA
jgi:glycosyltransferase involved in cell wall biosynthesis